MLTLALSSQEEGGPAPGCLSHHLPLNEDLKHIIYIYHVYIYHVYMILCMNSSSSDVSLGRRRSLSPRNLFLRPMSLSRACISQHTLSIMYILYSMPQRTLVFRGISFFWISFCWMSGVSTYIECMNVIDMYFVYIYT